MSVKEKLQEMSVGHTWDYRHLGPLTARDRRIVALHERLHLEHARAGMTPEEHRSAALAILAFERGLPARVPNAVLLNDARDRFNEATDLAVNRILIADEVDPWHTFPK